MTWYASSDKFVVAAPSVNFCGHIFSGSGIKADPEKVSTTKYVLTPGNLTDLHSFMGLINQLAEFSPDISAEVQDLCPLVTPKRTFLWTPDQKEAFHCVKQDLSCQPVLTHFDLALPTVLQTDASRLYGVGYSLL